MTTIRLRRGTATQWTEANPVLADGEPGYVTDTRTFKMGDGVTRFADLTGFVDESTADTAASARRKNPLFRIRYPGPFIWDYTGHSISAFGYSPGAVAGVVARQQFGSPTYLFRRFAMIGGDFSTRQGWDKQGYGGIGTIRGRGEKNSTPQTFYWYGDTLDFEYCREYDSEAVTVVTDGDTTGRTEGAGAQAYDLHVRATLPLGQHQTVVNVPTGSGRLYGVAFTGYDSTEDGVVFRDWTVGGSTLRNTRQLATLGSLVDGIPIEGDNGIRGIYDRDDSDLVVNGHDVNDPPDPALVAEIAALISSYSNARNLPVLHISSMAGHFARTSDPDKAGYDAIKRTYQSEAAQWANVSHFDWDALTRLPQDKIDDGTYQAAYYSGGDFIHPQVTDGANNAYFAGSLALCRMLGLHTPVKHVALCQRVEAVRRPVRAESRISVPGSPRVLHSEETLTAITGTPGVFRFKRPHNLAVGDRIVIDPFTPYSPLGSGTAFGAGAGVEHPFYVVAISTATDVRLSTTVGGTPVRNTTTKADTCRVYLVPTSPPRLAAAPAGYGAAAYMGDVEPTVKPYWCDPRIPNGAWQTQSGIDDYPTGGADAYGAYNSGNMIISGTAIRADEPSTLAVRIGSGYGVSLTPAAPGRILDRFGKRLAGAPATQFRFLLDPDDPEPVVLIVHLLTGAVAGRVQLENVGGTRIYETSWVPGLVPVLSGR